MALFGGAPEPSYWKAFAVLALHTGITSVRIVVGVAVGAAAGFATGLAVHFFKRHRQGNAAVLLVMRSIPLLALIPLFVYWFGTDETGIYVYIAFGAWVIIASVTYASVPWVPAAYTQNAHMLGATRLQIFRTVYVHAVQPPLAAALRDVLGLSWAFSLGAEYVAARSGLGYLVYQSYLYSDMGKLIVLAAVYVICGFVVHLAMNALVLRLQNQLAW